MSSRDRAAHDVLGRMSDDDDDDDVPDDLELTFVPKSQRLRRQHATTASSSHPTNPRHPHESTPSTNNSSSNNDTTADVAAAKVVQPSHGGSSRQRGETVYEQERNAKVRALLAEQGNASRSGIFSLDLFDSAADAVQNGAETPTFNLRDVSMTRGQQLPYATAPRDHMGRGGQDTSRRFRMPHPNMSEEEQARYIRSRRNMAVTRNALREVDPETLEYMQVTQAADQVGPAGRGGGGARGRGVATYRGRGMGYRGRGGMGGDFSGGGGRGAGGRGRGAGHAGSGGNLSFSPY